MGGTFMGGQPALVCIRCNDISVKIVYSFE